MHMFSRGNSGKTRCASEVWGGHFQRNGLTRPGNDADGVARRIHGSTSKGLSDVVSVRMRRALCPISMREGEQAGFLLPPMG
jgi:hypothetical protein